MIRSRCCAVLTSGSTIRPPLGVCAKAVTAASRAETSAAGAVIAATAKVRRGDLDRLQQRLSIGRGLRIEHDCDPLDRRRDLLERLQPFAADRKLEVGETGEVA